jgi:hypothetical protein
VWDDWNAGDEEDTRVRERVEMSFESVRLEKWEPGTPRGLGVTGSPRIEGGERSVSGGSVGLGGMVTPLNRTPLEIGWVSPNSVNKDGSKWS